MTVNVDIEKSDFDEMKNDSTCLQECQDQVIKPILADWDKATDHGVDIYGIGAGLVDPDSGTIGDKV